MVSLLAYFGLIALVSVERLFELGRSRRNEAIQFAAGGIEYGAGHYPIMVALHIGLLGGSLAETWFLGRPFIAALGYPMFALLLLAGLGRLWIISTLGSRWTTRVVVVPGQDRIRSGPYRFVDHPNYLIVVLEGFALPLIHSNWVTAIVFSIANGALLAERIRVENELLLLWTTMIDLIVAGGGPAGLATAIFAAQNGMQVVVVEPYHGSIDKACGEGIMPAGRYLLDQMGVVLKTGKTFLGVRYHSGDSVATGKFHDGQGLGIRRTELSRALWERATDLGVERHQGRVTEVAQTDTCVRASGIESRWLVAADGLHSIVAKSVGILGEKNPAGRYGFRRHFQVDETSDYVDVHLGDFEEAYVTPITDTEVGVAILSSEPADFEAILAKFPKLHRELGPAVGNIRGAGPFRRFASQLSLGRVALVGDAAGFLDPITGEGMRLGFESAQWAVDCMRRDRIREYDAGWRRIMRRYRWITSTLLRLRANPYAKKAIVPTLKTFPGVFDRTLALLASC